MFEGLLSCEIEIMNLRFDLERDKNSLIANLKTVVVITAVTLRAGYWFAIQVPIPVPFLKWYWYQWSTSFDTHHAKPSGALKCPQTANKSNNTALWVQLVAAAVSTQICCTKVKNGFVDWLKNLVRNRALVTLCCFYCLFVY